MTVQLNCDPIISVGQETPSDSHEREIIYEVGYNRISKKNWVCASIGTLFGYCSGISPVKLAIGAGVLSFLISADFAFGHARLLTPRKNITVLIQKILSTNQKSKTYSATSDPSKNPRIQVIMKATPSQIETIESARFYPAITCSHGACGILARAGLPHASFPRSLSPTWTAFDLQNQQKKDPSIQIKYLNWTEQQSKIEVKIASVMEASLIGLVFSLAGFIAAHGIMDARFLFG